MDKVFKSIMISEEPTRELTTDELMNDTHKLVKEVRDQVEFHYKKSLVCYEERDRVNMKVYHDKLLEVLSILKMGNE